MTPNSNAEQERIGVYVCHCGSNIAGTVDVVDVAKWAGEELKDRGVVVSRDYKFMCSSLGQELIEKDIKELDLTLRGCCCLLATPARNNFPHGVRSSWLKSLPV